MFCNRNSAKTGFRNGFPRLSRRNERKKKLDKLGASDDSEDSLSKSVGDVGLRMSKRKRLNWPKRYEQWVWPVGRLTGWSRMS